jgi:hypothetical protein
MRQAQPSPIVAGVGKGLHDRFEPDVDEPLPERWVDLIHYLNEKGHAALITKREADSARKR